MYHMIDGHLFNQTFKTDAENFCGTFGNMKPGHYTYMIFIPQSVYGTLKYNTYFAIDIISIHLDILMHVYLD